MPHKGPHISISSEQLVSRVLGLSPAELATWPESVRNLAAALAEELFLVRYNPFVDPSIVLDSVRSHFRQERGSLSREYTKFLDKGIKRFWREFEEDMRFRKEVKRRLAEVLDRNAIDDRPASLVQASTDATDLRMALPMLVVTPMNTEQIQHVVKLANEMDFVIVPRGGGSGATGGSIPAHQRTVILSLARCKEIIEIDEENKILCAQTGVITLQAIQAAARKNLLLTVDPASKAASSLGGNISENAGGPFAFEYGTTLDNIYSYTMVTPTGEIIEVKRKDHPRHKIMPTENAVFEVFDETGHLLRTISLPGDQIRGLNLGKDVTNKFLGGLPAVQKEGVDGIITKGCFILYPKQSRSRVLCLEFYGRSMHNAMLVIRDIVALRDAIRREGDLVKISALEEFGIKYVEAIEYEKKSSRYEGDPISVLIIQLDSDNAEALDQAAANIVDIVEPYDQVDVFTADDEREAELFWEDRHKLSAISKRTSGFKINEDIVIPLDVIPQFADFIEQLNLEYMARAYRKALHDVSRIEGIAPDDDFIRMELEFTSRIQAGKVDAKELTDAELEIQAGFFFLDLASRYPDLEEPLLRIRDHMHATRIVIANHMHAGDGNCHVNLPVNSNDAEMLHNAEEAAARVFEKVLSLKGAVSGEHGIGITKIGFLSDDKIAALKKYKKEVDPNNVLNTGKLTQKNPPVAPFTFSFNRLIEDIRMSGLPDKDRLISLLRSIQVCTRCGKCKQVCPMFYPQQSLIAHPRNKNISLGSLIEAVYYTQVSKGEPDAKLLGELKDLMEHCTGCGKCTSVCPVKIDTPKVILDMRAFLESKGAGGHPVKSRVLEYLARSPGERVPKMARRAAVAQNFANSTVGLIPARWRKHLETPLLQPGPRLGLKNLASGLHLERGSLFLPAHLAEAHARYTRRGAKEGEAPPIESVFYFPGCGGGLFYRTIGLATVMMLLEQGLGVVVPRDHLCCGYPLLVNGSEEAFHTNQARNLYAMKKLLTDAATEGLNVRTILTACGSCRDGLAHYELDLFLREELAHMDVAQFLLKRQMATGRTLMSGAAANQPLLYHASCHAEWSGVAGPKASEAYRQGLETITGRPVQLSPGCCGESGLGAMTAPEIYNRVRTRKKDQLENDLATYADDQPIVVGCPSCKIGVGRCLLSLKNHQPVLHTMEFLAQAIYGPKWEKRIRKAAAASHPKESIRFIDLEELPGKVEQPA